MATETADCVLPIGTADCDVDGRIWCCNSVTELSITPIWVHLECAAFVCFYCMTFSNFFNQGHHDSPAPAKSDWQHENIEKSMRSMLGECRNVKWYQHSSRKRVHILNLSENFPPVLVANITGIDLTVVV